jgi:hypothetical protein
MTIHKVLQMNCTSCSKELMHKYQLSFEDEKEMFECAELENWKPQILVQNGSKWDFCPKCYESHMKEK